MTQDYLYQFLSLSFRREDHIATTIPADFSFDPMQAFSVEAWIKTPELNTIKSIISQQDVFAFKLNGDKLSFAVNGLREVVSEPAPLLENIWHSVALLCYKGNVRIFLDGTLLIEENISGIMPTSTQPLVIGQEFFGNMRWVRLYRRCLLAEEVAQFMYNPELLAEMAAYYDFTQNPPVEKKTAQAIVVPGRSLIMKSMPAATFADYSYLGSRDGNKINPGGKLATPYTVQAWIYPRKPQATYIYTIFANVDGNQSAGMELALKKDSGRYRLMATHSLFGKTDNILLSTAFIEFECWTNVTVTFNGKQLSLFINGKADATKNNLASSKTLLERNQVRIGARVSQVSPDGEYWFNGYISEVNVWEKALDKQQIVTFMQHAPSEEEAALLASWSLYWDTPNNVVSKAPVTKVNAVTIDEHQHPAETAVKEIHTNIRRLRKSEQLEPLALDELATCRAQALATKGTDSAQHSSVSTYAKESTLYFVVHTPAGSFTVTSLPGTTNDWDAMTLWKIQFFIIILDAVAVYIFATHLKYTANLAKRIMGTVLRNGTTQIFFGSMSAAGMNAAILSMLKEFISSNALQNLIWDSLQLSFWSILTGMAVFAARLFGGPVAFFVWLGILSAALAIHCTKKPRRLPAIQVNTLSFIHNQANKIGGINVRKDATQTWPSPEWVNGRPESAPAVYRLSRFNEDPLCIALTFTRSDITKYSSVAIQATAIGADNTYMGNTDTVTVTFPLGRTTSNTAYFKLANHTIAAQGIQKKTIAWQWQYLDIEDNVFVNTDQTTHTIYTIISDVTTPWVWSANNSSLYSLPWTAAYDILEPVLRGSSTIPTVISKIMDWLYQGLGLVYGGNQQYTFVEVGPNGLDCQVLYLNMFLNHCEQRNFQTVNCQDCAALLSVLANMYGADLNCLALGHSFKVNLIKLIGESAYRLPNTSNPPGAFEYHLVATPQSAVSNLLLTPIYDCCLKYKVKNNEQDEGIETMAKGIELTFYQGALPTAYPIVPRPGNYYREQVAENSAQGIGKCAARWIKRYYLAN